jgi:ribosome-associated protein
MSSPDATRRDELRAAGGTASPDAGRRAEPGAAAAAAQRAGDEPSGEWLLSEIVRYASDKKAGDLTVLDMRGIVGYTDWLVVCSGNTERQTKAIHDGILEGCKHEHGLLPRRVEGFSRGDWILMDYLDVVVHIFTPATREYYRLEQLWGEASVSAVGEREVGRGLPR